MKTYTVYRKGTPHQVLIDDCDQEIFERYTWHITNKGYVRMNVPRHEKPKYGNRSTVPLHCVLLGYVDGKEIDHINRNKLNNRRSNLRHVTALENSANRRERSTGKAKSGYTGVSLRPNGKFQAVIRKNNKTITLGTYDTAEQAHAAFLRAKGA